MHRVTRHHGQDGQTDRRGEPSNSGQKRVADREEVVTSWDSVAKPSSPTPMPPAQHLSHRITESQNYRMVGFGKDLWGSSSPTPCLQQAAQHRGQAGLEYLQRRRLHSLPGQPGPGLRHPQREEVLPHGQLELPLLQFVPECLHDQQRALLPDPAACGEDKCKTKHESITHGCTVCL